MHTCPQAARAGMWRDMRSQILLMVSKRGLAEVSTWWLSSWPPSYTMLEKEMQSEPDCPRGSSSTFSQNSEHQAGHLLHI